MPWESDEEQTKPGRDWAKYMWIAIGVLVAVGAAAMFVPRSEKIDATRARLSHILIVTDAKDAASKQAALEEIKALQEQLAKGANFSKLAAQHSDDPLSAKNGGDIGWVHRGEMTDAVDNFIWTAPLNQVGDPIVTDLGIHLIIVRERKISKAEMHEMELKERVLNQPVAGETPAQ